MDQSDRIYCIHKHDQMRERKNQEDIDNSHALKKDGCSHIDQIKNRQEQGTFPEFTFANIIQKEIKWYRKEVKCKEVNKIQCSPIRNYKLQETALLQGP